MVDGFCAFFLDVGQFCDSFIIYSRYYCHIHLVYVAIIFISIAIAIVVAVAVFVSRKNWYMHVALHLYDIDGFGLYGMCRAYYVRLNTCKFVYIAV